MRKIFGTVVLLTLISFSAHAWNSVGHRAIAEVAWRQLSKTERREVSQLLKQHPHYDEMLASSVPRGADTNEWVFLMAAVWPDLVRASKQGQPKRSESITKYDRYPHAIGYPFVRPVDRDFVSIKNFYIAEPNAEQVLSNSIATAKDRKAGAHDRAVSLCWTLHLFGDLHQPLHAATWVSRDRTEWDGLGGNYIVLDPREKPARQVNLHSFWDQLGEGDPTYKSIAALADKLTSDSDLKLSVRKDYQEHQTIASWVQESFQLAVHFAYAEDRVRFAHIDDLKSGKVAEGAIPVLKIEYIEGAHVIAHRRLLLASERLTKQLKQIF